MSKSQLHEATKRLESVEKALEGLCGEWSRCQAAIDADANLDTRIHILRADIATIRGMSFLDGNERDAADIEVKLAELEKQRMESQSIASAAASAQEILKQRIVTVQAEMDAAVSHREAVMLSMLGERREAAFAAYDAAVEKLYDALSELGAVAGLQSRFSSRNGFSQQHEIMLSQLSGDARNSLCGLVVRHADGSYDVAGNLAYRLSERIAATRKKISTELGVF